MSSELRPYPKYKDSGVEWIGDIPSEWQLIKFKYLLKSIVDNRGKTPPTVNNGIPLLEINSLEGHNSNPDVSKVSKFITKETYDNFIRDYLKPGDILFATVGSIGKIAIVPNDFNFAVAQNIVGFRINSNGDSMYWLYTLMSRYFYYTMLSFNKGNIQDSIKISNLRHAELVFPSLHEQVKISQYLSTKTSEIDALIADKEKLITLLEEKRQAVITETVTKGLDPNVKMKDSGIEWIGEIPEHWETMKLKYLIELNPKKSEVELNIHDLVTFIPLDKIIRPGVIDYSLTKRLEEVYDGYTYICDNDIVMAKVTPSFENNNIAIANEMENSIGFGTTEFHVLRANKMETEYLFYLLQSEHFKQAGVSSMYGVGGLKRIPSEFIMSYKIALPNREEQKEIIKYLLSQNKKTENIIQTQRKTINKLKQYRESLIYEAVTGKIDLRDYGEESDLLVAERGESYGN